MAPSNSSVTSSAKSKVSSVDADAEEAPVGVMAPHSVKASPVKSRLSRVTSKLRAAVCLPAHRSDTSPTSSEAKEKKTGDGAPAAETMKSEFKFLDRKYGADSKAQYHERKMEDEDPDETSRDDWWKQYAFCVVRRYDDDGDLEDTCLFVNPQPLRQLLKDVIGDYPSDPIDVSFVSISAPYHSLFHYRRQLQQVGTERFEASGDTASAVQLQLLLEWIGQKFELEIAAHDRCLSSDSKAIAYDKLWTLFKPGELVHAKVLGHHRAFRIEDCDYDDPERVLRPGFNIHAWHVDWDGESFGEIRTLLEIPKYAGVWDVNTHDVVPFAFLDKADQRRAELAARGELFEAFAARQHFMEYEGIAVKKNPQFGALPAYLRFDATGRVMVDCRTFHRIDADDAIRVRAFTATERPGGLLTAQDRLLANAVVRGYSMAAKKFLELSVAHLSEIKWNTGSFEHLVLDATTKKTVQALVSTHSQRDAEAEGFDDIVRGKGQGLVCVLHGPPGVGKTLTAECVAEYVQRPLFMVSSGDLGVSSAQLDEKLAEYMDMASTWRAVLLIDEADVFLEQRMLGDLHRNAMVSVFLRVLEYYKGTLFLTTNRVATFDDAFKSRIHIPIRYTDLSAASRLTIWRNLCAKLPGGVDITDAEFATLAEDELNGRQIKNVIKAAESLASFDGVRLDFKQLRTVTKIQATFEKDLGSFGEIDYTTPGSAKRHTAGRDMYN